ncbi:GNAT family N-acetyltransferase, partial [Streptomyces sp. NPDC054956]
MNDPVILEAAATAGAPALVLRPWCVEDVAALVEAYRDPDLRRWAGSPMEGEGDGLRWVRAQEQGWATGDRFGFAVLEAVPDEVPPRLVGNVVLKGVASGKSAAEVGYWTAARA